MGLILLICFGLTIAAISSVTYLSLYIIYFFKNSILKTENYLNSIIICISLPVLVISVTISAYIFKIFYNEFGSYIWLPLIKNEIKLAETSFGSLVFFEEIDRVTGAAGGIKGKNSLYLISNNRKDEIEVTNESIYLQPEILILLKDRRESDPQKKTLLDGFTLFIDPNIFTLQEYKEIGEVISNSIEIIDQKLKIPRSPVEFFNGYQGRQPHITRICYLDKKSLNREFSCAGGETIKIYPNGASRVFFSKEAKRANGAKLKDYYILGNLKNNGRHMYVWYNIENFNVSKELNKLTMFDTVIENCYDNRKRNFFNEYTFEQQILKNRN